MTGALVVLAYLLALARKQRDDAAERAHRTQLGGGGYGP
jgi:hypothetical protein